jgi:hypothetical protein
MRQIKPLRKDMEVKTDIFWQNHFRNKPKILLSDLKKFFAEEKISIQTSYFKKLGFGTGFDSDPIILPPQSLFFIINVLLGHGNVGVEVWEEIAKRLQKQLLKQGHTDHYSRVAEAYQYNILFSSLNAAEIFFSFLKDYRKVKPSNVIKTNFNVFDTFLKRFEITEENIKYCLEQYIEQGFILLNEKDFTRSYMNEGKTEIIKFFDKPYFKIKEIVKPGEFVSQLCECAKIYTTLFGKYTPKTEPFFIEKNERDFFLIIKELDISIAWARLNYHFFKEHLFDSYGYTMSEQEIELQKQMQLII